MAYHPEYLQLNDMNSLDDATPSEIAEYWDQGQTHEQQQAHDPENDQTSDTAIDQASVDEAYESYFADDPMLMAKALVESEYWQDEPDDPPEPGTGALEAVEHLLEHEQLDIDRNCMAFLAQVMSLDNGDDFIEVPDEYSTLRNLKIELPILKHDPDLELLMLKQRHEVHISADGIEPWVHREEDGEDLDEVMDDPTLLPRIEAEIANETLDVSREVGMYIRTIAEPPISSDTELIEMLIDSEGPEKYKVETPILLAWSSPYSSALMDASLLEFNLTSTPRDLIAIDAAEADQRLLAEDEPEFASVGAVERIGQTSGLTPPHDSIRTSSEIDLSNLIAEPPQNVEVPLTPQNWTATSSSKTANGDDGTVIPHSHIHSPETNESPSDQKCAEQDLQRCHKDSSGPAAVAIEHRLQNEGYSALDTIIRVPVPEVDDSPPTPPWQGSQATNDLIKYARDGLDKEDLPFPGVSKLERKLSWIAFPVRRGKLVDEEVNNEELEVDESTVRYLASIDMDEELNVDSLVPKVGDPPRLRHHDSDDEELRALLMNLEPKLDVGPCKATAVQQNALPPVKTVSSTDRGHEGTKIDFSHRRDMQDLLYKRKLELAKSSAKPSDISSKAQHNAETATASNLEKKKMRHERPPCLSYSLGAGSIGQFLQLQGDVNAAVASKVAKHTVKHISVPTAVMATPQKEEHMSALIIPAPRLLNAQDPMQVIVGSSLLSDRTLIRDLQAQLPMLEIIERCDIVISNNKPKNTTPRMYNMECDITLSSNTGLIMTTLQKLKQKPLPGQNNHTGVLERIAAASAHYSHMVILVVVGESIVTGAAALDDRDCDAIAELTALAEALETAMEVFVLPGGTKEVVKWLAPLIVQHAGTVPATKLLQEETQWEHFLRLAGLNAYAAQTALVKAGQSGLSSSGHGLGLLLQMTDAQRMERFDAMLGESAVRRLNEVINSAWSSTGTAVG